LAWLGLACLGLAWLGLAWLGLAWLGRDSFNIGIQQKTHLQGIFKPTSRKPAAISRRTEEQHIKKASQFTTHQNDSQFRIRRSNLVGVCRAVC